MPPPKMVTYALVRNPKGRTNVGGVLALSAHCLISLRWPIALFAVASWLASFYTTPGLAFLLVAGATLLVVLTVILAHWLIKLAVAHHYQGFGKPANSGAGAANKSRSSG